MGNLEDTESDMISAPEEFKVCCRRQTANRHVQSIVATVLTEKSPGYYGNTEGLLSAIWTCDGARQVIWGLEKETLREALWSPAAMGTVATEGSLSPKTDMP